MSTRKKRIEKPKRKKLTSRQQELASKYIAEEMRTKKYSAKQAKAIGISRARKATVRARGVKKR